MLFMKTDSSNLRNECSSSKRQKCSGPRGRTNSCAHGKEVKSCCFTHNFCFLSSTFLYFMLFITRWIIPLFGPSPLEYKPHESRDLCFILHYIPISWPRPLSEESMKKYLLDECVYEWIILIYPQHFLFYQSNYLTLFISWMGFEGFLSKWFIILSQCRHFIQNHI